MGSVIKSIDALVSEEINAFLTFCRKTRGALYVDLNHDVKNSILVAGSGRGGTTWLAEIINADNSFRDIFEPFNPRRVRSVKDFNYRQYLRPMDRDPRYLRPAHLVFSGKLRDDWTDQYNRRFFCTRRLVKDIRVNLMLKWIHDNFLEMPIIFLLRHPCAVAVSRLSQRWKSSTAIEDFLSQHTLIEDHLKQFMPIITATRSDFEQHVLVWCIENYVPLRTLRKSDALVVFYENLCTRPETELNRIAEYLKLGRLELMMKRIKKPSSQTRKRASAIVLGEDPVSSWRKMVDQAMLNSAHDLLTVFGLTGLYARDPFPLVDSDDVLRSPGSNFSHSAHY